MTRKYLPWWRAGAATLIETADAPGIGSRATLDLTATVPADPGRSAAVTARLYGPGEVTGLDPGQVIRTEPAPGTTDFEPTRFCAVELRTAELPWMFTPARADAGGRLRPWLVLVVVEREHATVDVGGGRPAPVLATDPSAQLPDLAQSWAWAHVQQTADGGVLARLICPRRLRPQTAYVAALVPAFAQGAQAGLGQPVDGGALRPAWTPADTVAEIPVYHSWEFATGPAGDFEALAGRLRLHQAAAGDLAGLELALPAQAGGVPAADPVRVPGALGTGGDTGGTAGTEVTDRLADLLDVAGGGPPAGLPIAAPTYGRWHAGRRAAADVTGAGWLAGLNREPAARAVAALGTRVVQERQEQLMASAWAQAGPIERANRLLRQGQFAREAGAGLFRQHLMPLPDAVLLAVAGPAGARLLAADGHTMAAQVARSRVPAVLVTPAARRAALARGTGIADVIERANTRVDLGRPPARPAGMAAADDPRARYDLPRVCDLSPAWWSTLPATANPQVRAARAALARHLGRRGPCSPPAPPPPLPVGDLADAIRERLDPEIAIPTAVLSRLTLPTGWQPADPLEPVLAAPTFPAPMYREVAALAPNLLLPGVNNLPANSVTAAGTNPWFVQAFLAGLNHEMGRELLWRGFPTDQRGTCFRRFWDRPGPDADDITAMTEWDPADPLGQAGTLHDDPQLVLVLRADLLRRYPRAVIYAARAAWNGAPDPAPTLPATTEERYPVFSGALAPDVTFLGFDLPPEDARGSDTDPGWYLVLAEPPGEIRYGIDDDAPTAPTGTWADLSWDVVGTDAPGYVVLGATDPLDPANDPRDLHFSTGATSAQIAAVLEQRSYRVAIHARKLLPETS